jgi:hypothetical protein
MAAKEYFDAIGEVLAYALSAGDFIYGQEAIEVGTKFRIIRGNRGVDLVAEPNSRFFRIEYEYRLSNQLYNAYENDVDLLRGAIERYDINENEIGDTDLSWEAAYRRIEDIDENEAEKIVERVIGYVTSTDCRWELLTLNRESTDTDPIWDGIQVVRLLYPYEKRFGPRDYERTIQDAISVGKEIQNNMSRRIDAIQEIGGGQ